jgi:Flp pilus assembly pilin Flp
MPPSRNDRGATSAEYSLLAAAIAAVIVVILLALGQHVLRLFEHSCTSVRDQAAPTQSCE